MKRMKTFLKKITAGFLAGVLMLAGAVPAMAAEGRKVSNPAIVTLKTNRTYTAYDVTGDGISDKVTLKSAHYDYYTTGKQGYLKIYINDKLAYNFKDPYYEGDATYQYEVKLCTLDSENVFFFVRTRSEVEYYYFCKLYRYQDGKLKAALNLVNTYKNIFLHREKMDLVKVTGNRIQFEWYGQLGATGALQWNVIYELQNGTFKRTSRSCSVIKSQRDRTWTASRKFSVYKSAAMQEKVFTVKKGDTLKITHVYNNSKYAFVRVMNEDGKTGWIRCPNTAVSYFSEAIYAG
jgi:hypothetical protein